MKRRYQRMRNAQILALSTALLDVEEERLAGNKGYTVDALEDYLEEMIEAVG